MDPLYSNHSLDLLFKKLGHDLIEIRTRSLSSIVSKLEHGLLHEADLVQERQLLIRLLEWFNFQPAPMQEEVFGLLLSLAKHSSACEVLVSLGAGKFLSDLRPDLEPAMKPHLDSLLDRLFHVTDGALNDSSRCVYQKEGESLDATAGDLSSERSKPSQHLASGYFHPVEVEVNRLNAVQNQERPAMLSGNDDITSFIRFPGFPWHSLTATDRHVLASTSSSLCSSNTHLVRKACSFLLDVVFRDFPAEIFLQRPTIINTLLTLLGSRPGSNLMMSTSECMSFVAKNLLCRIRYYQDPEMYCPRQGLSFHRGVFPRFYQDDERSAGSRLGSRMEAEGERQERAGGDGRDESSATSSTESTFSSGLNSIHHTRNPDLLFRNEDDSLEEDQTAALQLSQISAQQFCISSLQTIVPLLRIDSPQMFLGFYQVASECISLLRHVLDPEQVWICKNQTAQTLQREVSSILEALGEAVLYHYHLNSSENTYQRSPREKTYKFSDADEWSLKFDSKHDATYHRVAYHACSILAIKFLTSVIPVEKSNHQIKSRLTNALYVITCDAALAVTFANVCETAEAYLEQCNKEKYEIVCRLRKVLRSIRHTHEFLDEIAQKDKDMDAALESAESSLECLPYYSVKDQIYLVISIISEACNGKVSTFQALHLNLSRNILLQLLSHPITRIRSSTYEACLKVSKSSLNVITAAEDPKCIQSHRCNFLIDSSVLYEICLHGIGDSSVLVSSPAQDLLLVMLHSKLLMDESLWMKFREVLQPVMPVLQAFTGETELLRSAVFDLFNPCNQDCSYLEIIQSLIRALLIKQRSLRSFAGGLLGKILARHGKELRENDDSLALLLTRASNIVGLTDLLMVENPLSLVSFDAAARSANSGLFHEDAVVRMLGIFRSRSVEWPVRRSSLQQLAVMLNDPKLHDIFLKSDGLLTIKLHLTELVQDSSVLTEPEKLEADACISLIKSVARLNPGIRQDLYSDTKVLLSLLRTVDLCRLSSSSLCQASATLALLLFHDVLQDLKLNKEISLPATVLSRYQIPFLCPSHHVISIHRTQTSLPTQYDPLVVGPAAFAISVTSSIVKHGRDVVETLKSKNEECAGDQRSHSVAKMMEVVAMTYSYPISAVSEIVDSLSNATSHPGVRHFVTLLRILLISNPERFSSTVFSGDSWRASMNKFLAVLPSSVEDESLLLDVVHLLDDLMDAQSSFDLSLISTNDDIVDTLTWLLDICIPTEDQHLTTHKPLFSILESSEPQREPFPPSATQVTSGLSSVTVRRCLCKSILSLLSHVSRRLPSILERREGLVHRFQAFLCQVLLIRLKLADAPQFYDLPSMEVTLECLKHVTASGPGWLKVNVLDWESRYAGPVPSDGTILCRQLTVTLLEVVSAFDIESRNSSMSYMGKGVSRSATQSILHLVHEMARCASGKVEKQDWLSLLHHVTSLGNVKTLQVKHPDAGYKWMLPLWSARDPRIRLSGVSLAVAISRTVPGCIALSNSFENYFGGLWSMCFEVYFDDTECSAVRSQAAHLLSNLISHEFQTPSGRGDENIWQGPVVRDEESGATLTGIPALIALLRHLKFHNHVAWLTTRYHRSSTIQPVLILYTPFISSTSYSSSTPGGDSLLSPSGFGNTPVTQQSMSVSENDTLNSRSVSSPCAQNESTSTSGDLNIPLGLMSNPTPHIRPSRESLGSASSSLPPEWQSVYTPTLISNTCTLLCNAICLMPHEIIDLFEQNGAMRQIGHLLDAAYLRDLLQQLKQYANMQTDQQLYRDEVASIEATASSLICQYSETCRMLHAYASHDRNVAFNLLKDQELFGRVTSLLSLPSPYENWDSKLSSLKMNAMNFISVATQLNVKRAAEDIKRVLSQDWMAFSRSVLNLLSVDSNSVLTATLAMVSSLLTCLGIQLKMNESEASFCSLFNHSTGEDIASELCAKVINIFGTFLPKSNLEENFQVVSICCTTLQVLFTTSLTSKETAIETGFVEQILEELKQVLSKLELFSTSILAAKGKTKIKNQIRPVKECEHIIKMIQVLLTLLNNFLHDSSDVKTITCGAGFGQILAKIWGWTPLYPKLQASVLRVSSAYCANCENACSSLAVTTVSQPSFTFNIVTLARDIVSKVTLRTGVQASHQHLVYSLLCNLTASHECRAVIWKSSLLNEFHTVADKGQHPKRSKQQMTLLMHWLKLLHCLSFHTDGQLNILRVHDVLEILLEIRETNIQNSDMVMKILRNLCFHAPSKQRISANKTVLRHLKQEMSTGETGSCQLSTSSALWSLLTNNQKAKVHLKGAGVTGYVQSMMALLNQQENSEKHEELLTSLSAVLDIMQQ